MNVLKITVYRNAITWSYVDGFSVMVEQDHTILIEDEDGAAVIGDIINSIQDDHGRVGLEISTVDIAI